MDLAEVLCERRNLSDGEFLELLGTDESDEKLFFHADLKRKEFSGNDVYMRGLIEFTNYCKNNCYYCGIRRGNEKASRYRMGLEDILKACENGYVHPAEMDLENRKRCLFGLKEIGSMDVNLASRLGQML